MYRVLLIFVILVVVNILSDRFFLRIDATADKQYTLSNATKNILRELDEPVTITAYFTEDLPADLIKTRRDFQEMLVEFENASKGKVAYQFIDPGKDQETEQRTVREGIQPVIVNVREKDQVKQQKAYLGAILQKGLQSEKIPYIQPGAAMEYDLATAIKKLTIMNKPLVGYVTGLGGPPLNALQQVVVGLDVLNNLQDFNLGDSGLDLTNYETIALVGVKDSIPLEYLQKLDLYLAQGGNLFIAYDRVSGNLQTAQGESNTTGLETWLSNKGLMIENNFVVDASCERVGVRQPNFPIPISVNFPYFPVFTTFEEHPITQGIERIPMTFASSIIYTGDTSLNYQPLIKSSSKSGTLTPPLYFNIQKQWAETDFPLAYLTVGAALAGNIVGNQQSKMVVIADGEFPVNGVGGQARNIPPDNANLMVNSIDWLSDDTGLIELRTKGVTSRPLEQIKDSSKALLKWFNFLVPILLIIIYGLIRSQHNRNIRKKRMEEGYV